MIEYLRDTIIPPLNAFCGVPVIRAEQTGKKPAGSHATYKFTTTYAKDAGNPEVVPVETADGLQLRQRETNRFTLSFSAYAKDDIESRDLAQKIHDWFNFHGQLVLQDAGVAVVDITNVENRDALIVDDYERRNGFDVILRVDRELLQDIEWIETVEINNEIYPKE